MKDSKAYYDHLATSYQSESNSRKKYLTAIDNYTVESINGDAIYNYLDIGAGNGSRSLKIAKSIPVQKEIFLIDNSSKMLENVSSLEQVKVFNESVFDFNSTTKFNLITCLWNVIGHFETQEARLQLFKKVSLLLEPGGVFIFDVNNRYNISHYGLNNVEQNIKNDNLNVKDSGWFTLGEKPNQTKVYIHSPFDIYDYIKETDLILEENKYIDYSTGETKSTFFEGQLVYKIRKPL
ncbi:methyltransferase domain-containing protein [Winogradskyella helgolandensis]|uniref:methyltransferase domain-containing protein n=1 Tax=Winogradskyella helgolandensis TaxID=2697010 RepID=UPI0015B99003|nr:class I SAM-dependent methyltransferase [Winogradskyella helgolandensis]